MKRIVIIAVIAAVALGGGFWILHRRSIEPPAQALFATAVAHYGPLTVDVSGSGTVQATSTANVSTDVSGTVASVDVKVGSRVEAGQVLARLDDGGAAAARLAGAQAALRSDQASLANLISPPPPTSDAVQAAKARLAADQARLAADVSDRQDLTVDVPMAGVVTAVDVQEGEQVVPGAPLFTVGDPSSIKVTISVPEIDIQNVRMGQQATVWTIDSGIMKGSVTAIGAQSTGADRFGAVFPVTITVPHAVSGLKDGMNAQVSLSRANIATSSPLVFAHQQTVRASVQGTVDQVAVQAGQTVSSGQEAVTLSNPSLALAVASDRAAVAQDQENLNHLVAPPPPNPRTIASWKARVTADQRNVAADEVALADLTLRAPIAGTVTAVNIQPGERVGMGTAFTIQNLSSLKVLVPISEIEIHGVRLGQKAQVTADALPGETFPGTVSEVDPAGTNSQGVADFNVTVALERDTGLKPGMSATVSIRIASLPRALLVPVEAVTGVGRKARVRVLVDGRPVVRKVDAGLASDSFVQILSGLKAGDVIITAQASRGNIPFGNGRRGGEGPGAGGGRPGQGGGS